MGQAVVRPALLREMRHVAEHYKRFPTLRDDHLPADDREPLIAFLFKLNASELPMTIELLRDFHRQAHQRYLEATVASR